MPAPNVAPGQPIQSAWGNAVVADIAQLRVDFTWGDNDLRARQPRCWAANNQNVFPLPPNVWTPFSIGPAWTAPFTAQYLVTVSAMVSCDNGDVWLNFQVDNSGFLMETSAQANCKNGEGMQLVAQYPVTLGQGGHSIIVGGNTNGSGGSIRAFNTNVVSLTTS